MILSGKIVNGKGVASYWIKKVKRTFLKKTNMNLYIGTLNVKLNKPYFIEPDFIIYNYEYGGTQNVLVKKCQIFNKDVYIVRSEKNQDGTGDYGLDIIEIVADICLRDKYHLPNDTIIQVKV